MQLWISSRRTLTAAALLLTLVTAQAQDSSGMWTLERCLDVAVQNSPRLAASRQSAAGVQAAAREAAASRLPTLGVTGNYSYSSEVQQMTLPISLPGVGTPHINFGDGNTYDLSAVVRTPIYSGGSLMASARASASAATASRYDLATDSLSLLYNVRRAYYTALGAASRAEAARNSAARIQRNLQTITDAQQIGANSEENRITALSRLRQTEELVISAKNQAHAARLQLGSLVLKPGEEITPAGDLKSPLVGATALAAVPLPERTDVSALTARVEQSRYQARAASGSLLPSLSGNAIYHYAKPGLNVTQNDWMDYYTVGLTASWTLWDWNTRHYRVEQARASGNALQARREDLLTQLRTRNQTALDALAAAEAVVNKAVEHADLERQRLAMVDGRLKLGAATETEYLDAQDDLTAAETDLAAALASARLAEADLLNASGY